MTDNREDNVDNPKATVEATMFSVWERKVQDAETRAGELHSTLVTVRKIAERELGVGEYDGNNPDAGRIVHAIKKDRALAVAYKLKATEAMARASGYSEDAIKAALIAEVEGGDSGTRPEKRQ